METQQEVTTNNNSVTTELQKEVQQELTGSSPRVRGQVKWFNSKKGFGFITYNDGSQDNDIFVHHTCIKYSNTDTFRNLVTGEYVEFEVSPCPGKDGQFQAEQVTGINQGLLMSEVRNNNRTRVTTDRPQRTRNPRSNKPNTSEWKTVEKK